VSETLGEEFTRRLSRLMWVIDLNRQIFRGLLLRIPKIADCVAEGDDFQLSATPIYYKSPEGSNPARSTGEAPTSRFFNRGARKSCIVLGALTHSGCVIP